MRKKLILLSLLLISLPNWVQAQILRGSEPEKYQWSDVISLLQRVIQIALSVAGFVALLYIILGAFQYFTAYGNEEKAEAGKKTLTWAIIGLIIVLVCFAIVTMVYSQYAPSMNLTPRQFYP